MILTLLVGIVVIWVIFTYLIPLLPEPIKTPVKIVLIILVIVWLLRLGGINF